MVERSDTTGIRRNGMHPEAGATIGKVSTYASLNYHLVFSTKLRAPSIEPEWQDRLHAYLAGTIRGQGGVALAVGGVADHVHILAGLKTTHSVANVMQSVKKQSSVWIHDELKRPGFAWQEGYGAFTVSPHDLAAVRGYIASQETHHKTRSSQEELMDLCREAGIEIDPRYFE